MSGTAFAVALAAGAALRAYDDRYGLTGALRRLGEQGTGGMDAARVDYLAEVLRMLPSIACPSAAAAAAAAAGETRPEAAAIDQKNFVFSMRLLGVMDVGKAGDGSTKISVKEN